VTPSLRHQELISTFFLEFLELFLPAVASTIDPNSIVSLQQEYFADLVEGEEKIVDLLFSVKRSLAGISKSTGTDTTFLIHIEAQADSQTNFNRRLFFYFARLHQKHLQPIYPIVIFSFDEPKRAEPETYSVECSDLRVLDFRFKSIQLNRLNWRDFINQPNPVAAALMSKMKIAKKDRPKVKAECLRLLLTLRLEPAKTRLVSKFVDTYLRLDLKEEKTFQAEIDKLEPSQKEEIMENLTSWEERGVEKERRTIALSMLQDNLPLEQISRHTRLTIEQLQQIQAQSNQG
jgi:predicted transposase/invertase (TIGR01784 family)